MKNTFKRSGAALISLVLLLVLAVSAGAASSQNVGVKFWKERSDKESMANSGIDPDRTATLTRQANGTYTLTLPVTQVSKLGVTGYLSGLTIGDVTYDGTLTGDFNKATAVLTIKNLPASVLTGSDVNKSVLVTCNIQCPDVYLEPEVNGKQKGRARGPCLFVFPHRSILRSTRSVTMVSSWLMARSAPLASLRAMRLTCRWFCAIAMVPTAPRAAPAAMPSRTLPEEG